MGYIVDRSDEHAEQQEDDQVGAGRHAVDAGNQHPESRPSMRDQSAARVTGSDRRLSIGVLSIAVSTFSNPCEEIDADVNRWMRPRK